MVFCNYKGCKNKIGYVKTRFKLPKNEHFRKIWIFNSGIEYSEKHNMRNMYICVDHFDKKYVSMGKTPRVCMVAIPIPYWCEQNILNENSEHCANIISSSYENEGVLREGTKLRTNKQQLQRFIELLQSNVEVARATSLKHEAIYKWDEFTLQLNKLGPPKKDWEQWFRVWSELKAMVRKKNKKACQPPTKTLPNGTLIKHVVQFTELEKTVIEILGLDKDENESGNQEIKTSRSNFSITLDGTGDDDVSFEPTNKRIKYNTYESVTKQSSTESEEEPSTSNPSTQTIPRLKELEEVSTEIKFEEEEEVDYEDTISVYSIIDDDIKFEDTDFDEEMTQTNTNESLNKQADEQPFIKTEPEDHDVEEVLPQLSTYIKTEPVEQEPEEEQPSISIKTEPGENQAEKEQPSSIFIKTEPEEHSISTPIIQTVPKPIPLPTPSEDCKKAIEEQTLAQKEFYKNMTVFMGDMRRSMSNIEDYIKRSVQQKDDLLEVKKLKLKAFQEAKLEESIERKQKLKMKAELLALKKLKSITKAGNISNDSK
ncbi:uncharacterized protein LOC129909243 isoform X3 [Episyrphus balteatus]|uniref:uncharacterized protein LOC129909243 isoform X3 n=1 Tax=Episyrphus balteatus TaxID=286459 RepID=UPI00248546C3|nr:uncharacterized protein LOC129909243 isoform X3 [Episyrphus balteatus]